ncbi:MAG: ABC transporter permease [Bacteroidales bacterium]|nr:ABC transporter permease [Clostridium sp.]MCM1204853.1 ABC transporter permease [Bacteroidales bacterium]
MAWIWHLCFTNMKKRGVRTGLTILGVVIGIISIVSLLAIGIGVKSELLSVVETEGSITEIKIYGESEGRRKNNMITERRLREVEEIEHIETVYPRLTLITVMTYERFVGYVELVGIPEKYLGQINIEHGATPENEGIKPGLLLGEHAMALFFNVQTGMGYTEAYENDEEKLPDISGKTMKVKFGVEEELAEYKLDIAGIANDESYDIYCDLEMLKKYLKRIAVDGKIPGQPINQNDENYREWIYDSAVVRVDDVEQVDRVIKQLQDMGFRTENNKEFVDSVQQEIKILQILLGGIGMIALIVAVIGISNTMTTAVYDRINEIGILKVLGCDPDELLYLFLLESGILGGLGGLIGIICSYGITEILVNRLAVKLINLPKGTELAVIPLWLAAAAFFFAVFLGVFAGFFPAKWAYKLKPIDAVRK